MSFNLKKYAANIDDKSFNPSDVPGQSPIEKLQNIGSDIEKSIGQPVSEGQITEPDVYGLLRDKAIGHPHYPILDQIRKNIPQLRSLAAEAVKMNGGDPSNEKSITDAVGIVIQKVLERIETKFVPQLIQIYSSSTRTEDKMNTLLEVEDENLIPTIREFISKEIIKAKKDALENFKNRSSELIAAGFTMDDVLLLINDGIKTGSKQLAGKYSEEKIAQISTVVSKLMTDVANMPNRYWNQVLALHPKLPTELLEQWKKFQFTPIEWSMKTILREAGFNVVAVRQSSSSNYYYHFYPEAKDDGTPFESDFEKRQYALSRLKELISDEYNSAEQIQNLMEDTLADPNNNVATLIQYYFRSSKICNRDRTKFLQDLDAIGSSNIREKLQETIYTFKVDKRYAPLNLLQKSGAEIRLLKTFRTHYNLDPIPLDLELACPNDCPTNESMFKIDFMLPGDTLEGFDMDDDGTIHPIVKTKVMFIGEYFGEDRTVTETLKDKEWFNPDGTPAYYIDRNTGEHIEMKPGQEVEIRNIYSLRSRWKVATSEAIGHLIGTDALALKRRDLSLPENLMPKLDEKNIIYLFDGDFKTQKGCKAIKLMVNQSLDSPITLHYVSDHVLKETMNSNQVMLSNIVECAIVSIKIGEGLQAAKLALLADKDGFYRDNLWKHLIYFKSLQERRDKIKVIIASPTVLSDRERLFKLHIEYNNLTNEMNKLENSPLKTFKNKLDEILSGEKIKQKIMRLENLKSEIISGNISPTMEELVVMVKDIKQNISKNVVSFNNKKITK